MAYTSGFTAVVGATFTAAQYNTNVRDNFAALWVYSAVGDLAYAGGATSLTRLPIGSAGKQLGIVAGAPAWVDGVPGIFTAAGQLVYGAAADTAGLLAIAAAGSLLQSSAGLPAWLTPGAENTFLGISSGIPAWIGFIGARVTKGAQSIANASWTTISFDTESFDTGGFFSPGASTRLTIPHDGYYLIFVEYMWDVNAVGIRQIAINHSILGDLAKTSSVACTGITTSNIGIAMHYLPEGSYVVTNAYQNSGGALNTVAVRFYIIRLGV